MYGSSQHIRHGFLEAVYKDALEIEFGLKKIGYSRERKYEISYKNECIPHYYVADFVILDKIILEVKSVKKLKDLHIAQTLNYLKASGNKIAILVNFSRENLEYKRLIL